MPSLARRVGVVRRLAGEATGGKKRRTAFAGGFARGRGFGGAEPNSGLVQVDVSFLCGAAGLVRQIHG